MALERDKNLYFHILIYEIHICFLLQRNEDNSGNHNQYGVFIPSQLYLFIKDFISVILSRSF